jgi:hypothetical protein
MSMMTGPSFQKLAAITLAAAGLLGPLSAGAQECKAQLDGSCLIHGAICSPVSSGVGPTGHCATVNPTGEKECDCVGAPELSLTGTWIADDGSIFYLRQIGNEFFWAGFSVELPAGVTDFHTGLQFTNVFEGQISGNSAVIGDWADVPRGRNLGSGALTLSASNTEILRLSETGGFGPSRWERVAPAPPPNEML